MKEKDLLELKEKVNSARDNNAELTGEKKALVAHIKEEWGCTTAEQLLKKEKEKKKIVKAFDKEINKGLEVLENKYFKK